MRTRAYFGDGVYAEFTGFDIVLTANGVGAEATDRIHLERGMPQALVEWQAAGYPDHSSGRTFAQTVEAARPAANDEEPGDE